MHDAWAPYDTYDRATHALCGAHVQRELVAVFDTSPKGVWTWARQAHDALLDLKTLVADAKAAGDTSVDPARRDALVDKLRAATVLGANRPGVGKRAAKHRALARRLRDYLRFLDDGFERPAKGVTWVGKVLGVGNRHG